MAKFQYVSDVICLWAIFFAVGVFTGLQARYFRVMNFSVCVSFGLGMYANAIVVVNNGPIIWTILLSAGAGATMQIVASTGWAFLERGAFLFLSFVSLFLIRALSIATANPMRAPGSLRNLTNGIAGLGFAPIGVTDLTNFLSEIGAFVLAISGIIGAWWMIVARRGYVFSALGEDPGATASYGHSVFSLSVLCFALSGAGLGIAGAAYAEVIGYVDPNVFSISLAARILIVGFVFSNRSLSAIAIAAIFVSVLPEIIRLVISGVWAAELEQIIYV